MNPYTFTTDSGAPIDLDVDALCCIVQLPVDDDSPDKVRPLGTGFYLFCNRIVITAKHVFTDCDEHYGPICVHNLASNGGAGMARYLSVPQYVYGDPVVDIAMIILPDGQSPPMIPFLPGPHDYELKRGFVAIGYTPTRSEVGSNHWKINVQLNHVDPVHVEERERTHCPVEFSMSYDAPFAEPGHSGGPLVDVHGRVVGVVIEQCARVLSSGDTSPRNVARATSIRPIIELARRHLPAWLLSPEVRAILYGERVCP